MEHLERAFENLNSSGLLSAGKEDLYMADTTHTKNETKKKKHDGQDPLLKETETFVYDFFRKELPEGMHYHDFLHTRETAEATAEIAGAYDLDDTELQTLLLAAWLHDTGYAVDYNDHETESKKIAQKFLDQKIPEQQLEKVLALIDATRPKHKPESLYEEIIKDADSINIGKKRFFRKGILLRLEWEKNKEFNDSDARWAERQLKFLTSKCFYTKYAREEYGSRLAKNIEKQSQMAVKAEINEVKRQKLGRGIETMYRSVYRSHIDLSSMADSKANMMISINTIIVSIIMAAIGSGFTLTGHDFLKHIRFTVPMALLILGCMISVAFAIISASPNVTNQKVKKKDIIERKSSVLFFGNFVDLKLDRFIADLKLLRDDQEIVYDNMSIDIYYLGHVLRRKYRLLNYCYMSFLTTLCICVLTFLTIYFLSL